MFKKRKPFVVGLVTLLSAVTLAACSKTTGEETKLVTLKGDTITVADFYQQVKGTRVGQQAMLTLVLERAFEEQYGDKISQQEVTDAYNKEVEAYGDNFQAALNSAGMTEDTYKQQIRLTKLIEHAVEKTAEEELTDEHYQQAFEAYQPETSLELIQLSDKAKADEVLERVRAEGADFAAIAKEETKAAEEKIDYRFDSADTTLPKEVQQAAFDRQVGEVSDVITVTNPRTFAPTYYILKVTDKAEKKADQNEHKDRLKQQLLNEKTADTAFQNQVIAKVLEKANVKVKDDSFATILSQYGTPHSGTAVETPSSQDSTPEENASEDQAKE